LSGRNFFWLAIIWTVLITIASLVSFNSIPKVKIVGSDKMIHFLFYLVFVILWGLAKKQIYFNRKYDFLIVVVAIIYGIIIEVLQSVLTSTRQADFYDVLANAIGAIFGLVILLIMKSNFFFNIFLKHSNINYISTSKLKLWK
jgi:VanZ family protein